MDSNSTPQTVAQAVQAATQQQQQQQQQQQHHQQPHSSPGLSSPHVHAATVDNLTCQWQGCGERCENPELLYEHVCDRHVGRKSTNNLNLTCHWGACRTTTVKRDHITSHIRVHVPLKPHKCEFCGKAFKRPQDLKKHVKTHADDSVLMNSAQHGQNGRVGANNGVLGQNGKPSYYSAAHDIPSNPYSSYQPAMGNTGITAGGYSHPPNTQYAGYGSVSYPNNGAIADIQSLDTRRRAIEALNDFLGDIKRRAIDPNAYYDVGNRLQSTALPLPVGTGYNTGYNNSSQYSGLNAVENFNNGYTQMSNNSNHVNLPPQTYALPLPNARTKNDLQDIDRFLEQLQATVYETSSNAAAAAGINHPSFENFINPYPSRSSNSPPTFGNHSNNGTHMSGLTAPGTGMEDAQVHTPSSISSYASSSHSPMSSHSRASFASSSGVNMYPSLPSVTSISDLGAGFPATTSAPASSLISNFGGLEGRRYSGGTLQRQAPAASQDTEMADADTENDGSRTPRQSDQKRPDSKGNSTIDPALRGEENRASPESTATTPATAADERRNEEWVENIRVIEALRKWIGERLKAGEFEETDATMTESTDTKDIDRSAVETAKMATAEMADEKLQLVADALKAEVNYPSLPTV